jgi:uncharacterized protein (DUF1800 family)
MTNTQLLDQPQTGLDEPGLAQGLSPASETASADSEGAQHLLTAGAILASAAALAACGGGNEDAGGAQATAATPTDGRVQRAAVGTYGRPDTAGAFRFLQQATMGATEADLTINVPNLGYAGWLDAQMSKPYSNAIVNKVPSPETYAYVYAYARAGGPPKDTLNPGVPSKESAFGTIVSNGSEWSRHVTAYLWQRSVYNDDQLRQRVVYALSQFLVTSMRHEVLGFTPMLMAGYLDMLSANAFGNFRTLIENVCRSPAMGYYLTHVANTAPDIDDTTSPPSIKRIPDQNFARELLQLFTLGLTKLKMDGTPVLVNGLTVPTLAATDVTVLSNVFTGWALDNSADYAVEPLQTYRYRSKETATADLWCFQERDELYDTSNNGFDLDKRLYYFGSRPRWRSSIRYVVPMAAYTTYQQKRVHEINKDALGNPVVENLGEPIQAHSTQVLMRKQLGLSATSDPVKFLGSDFTLGADPHASMKKALDLIFAHQNLAPFVAKQMIQHLVTSNPSTSYVNSVATAFKNSGWDMKTLIKAVLLDTEARTASGTSYGRLKDPYLRVVQLFRGFGVRGLYPAETISIADANNALNLNHQYMWAPSVFNDFSPRYAYKGSRMDKAGKVTPQMQICTETSSIAYVNAIHDILKKGLGQSNALGQSALPDDTTGDSPGALLLKPFADTKPTPQAIVNKINLLYFGNTMSTDLQKVVLTAATGGTPTDATLLDRIKAAIFLAAISSEFLVQR